MGDKIYVPYQEAESEFVEKRSRFIGHIWPVDSEDQAQELLRRVKKQHYDARHNCWCYLLGGSVVRYSDDGEPQGTAGQPMLAVFQREHVTNVLCVVTRYFGGILLGAGGLTRAYSKSARDALAAAGGLSSVGYLAYWGYATSVVTIITAILSPILGTLADTKGFKKPIFILCVWVGIVGCIAMGKMSAWLPFLVIFVIAKVGFSGSLVYYDSMLSDVTSPERMDEVSSKGYAWGYIGSCVPFVACLGLVLGADKLGISQMKALDLALLITAFWWLLTTLPLLNQYKQLHYVEVERHAIRQSFARIGHTIRHLPEDKQVFWFLLAFFCYIDGVYTIIDMATAYGTALGLDTTGLLLALLLTQIVAFPSALIFGRLSSKYPSTALIPVCIAAYAGIAVFAFFLTRQWQFWVLAVIVGMFQGGVQALSRSHFAKIIPPEKSGEYFGLFDICGKGASFLGTMIVSVGSQLTGSANVGVGSLIVLFVVGFVLFRVSCKAGVITDSVNYSNSTF